MDKAPPPHRTQIPNIVDDLGLDPYERALYVHYKRVCGENQGAYCYEAVKTTAHKVKMSTGQVSVARRQLAKRGLILVQDGRPVIITVLNIWELNTAFYKLEHRPDVDGWTVEQLKLWLADVHTVNVSSHNDSNIDTRSEPNLTYNDKDVHTVNEHSPSEHSLTDEDNMSSNVHTVKQRIDSSLLESIKDNPITSPYGEGGPPPPPAEIIGPKLQQGIPEVEKPPPRTEYTPFLRKFLAYFNAKRFRNDTQTQTVSGLVEKHGETEVETVTVWAAKKGMGLGQAIPAIESALKNPRREKGATNGQHYNKPKRTVTQVISPEADPDLFTRMQQAAIRAAADDP